MTTRLTLLLSLLWLPIAQAADTPPPTVNVEFSLYLWQSKAGYTRLDREIGKSPTLYYFDGSAYRRITTRFNSQTKTLQYRGPLQPIRFYASDPTGAETLPQPVAEATFPADWKELIFFLLPGSKAYHVVAAEDSAAHMPEGTVRVYNFSKAPIAVMVDEKRKALKTRENADYRIQGENVKTLPIKVAALSEAGEWDLVYSSKITARTKDRYILMAYRPHPDREYYNVKTLRLPQ